MTGPIDIYLHGKRIGPGARRAPEGEHCRLPTLSAVRLAFLTVQQSLRLLQSYPQPLLNVATFPFTDAPGHAGIDQALDLLEREVATLKSMRENYRAGGSGIAGTDA